MCSREQDLVGVAAGEVIKLSKERQLTCAARKHLLFEFSLCLSRACLGKNDHFENESTVNKSSGDKETKTGSRAPICLGGLGEAEAVVPYVVL